MMAGMVRDHDRKQEAKKLIRAMLLENKKLSEFKTQELIDLMDDIDYLPDFFARALANEIESRIR